MSHENTGGESPPILRGSGKREMFSRRLAKGTIIHLFWIAQSRGLNVTQCLEDLILRQKAKKIKK